MRHLLTLAAAGFAACVAAPTPAAAAVTTCAPTAPYYANYQYSLAYQVRAIWKYNGYPAGCGSSSENSSTQPAGVSADNGVFTNDYPILRELQLGITDLPGNGGQQHLVIFSATDFGGAAIGRSFETLFPHSNEAALIAALRFLAGDTGIEGDPDALNSFAEGDARNGTFGDAAFALGDPFDAIAFSDGQLIGTGTSSARLAGAVPEPASWALMVLGLGGVGAALRRRRGLRPRFA